MWRLISIKLPLTQESVLIAIDLTILTIVKELEKLLVYVFYSIIILLACGKEYTVVLNYSAHFMSSNSIDRTWCHLGNIQHHPLLL